MIDVKESNQDRYPEAAALPRVGTAGNVYPGKGDLGCTLFKMEDGNQLRGYAGFPPPFLTCNYKIVKFQMK